MNIYDSLNNADLIDAVSFFPELKNNSTIKGKLTPKILATINSKSVAINSQGKSNFLTLLIDRYFDLNAYSSFYPGTADLLEVATQFIFRKKTLDQLNPAGNVTFLQSKYSIQDSIFNLLHNPIIDHSRYPFLFAENYSSVSDLNVGDLHTVSKVYAKDGSLDFIENFSDLLIEHADILETKAQQAINKKNLFNLLVSPIDNALSPKITATIDLNINDSQLKKDFANYLSKKRKELAIQPSNPKSLTQGKITSLVDNGVLQYIDLRILDLYVNGHDTIEQRVFGNYIFPATSYNSRAFDETEKIRKSTMPQAKWMLDKNTITLMVTQAGKRSL